MSDEDWIAMPTEVFSRTLHHWMLVMWLLGICTGNLLVLALYLAHELATQSA